MVPSTRGDQAGGEHAVGDALAEDRGLRRFGVDVDRVGVHADRRIQQDVGLGDGLGEAGGLADLEVFEEIAGGHGAEPRWVAAVFWGKARVKSTAGR